MGLFIHQIVLQTVVCYNTAYSIIFKNIGHQFNRNKSMFNENQKDCVEHKLSQTLIWEQVLFELNDWKFIRLDLARAVCVNLMNQLFYEDDQPTYSSLVIIFTIVYLFS